MAGFIAGSVQSCLSTPIDNIFRRLSSQDILSHRSKEGVGGIMIETVRQVMKMGVEPLQSTPPSPSPSQPMPTPKLPSPSPTLASFKSFLNNWAMVRRMRVLWSGWSVNIVKDGLGFTLFFGFFETTRIWGKRWVKNMHESPHDTHHPCPDGNDTHTENWNASQRKPITMTLGRVGAVIVAGSLAGMGYQLISYPFDRIVVVSSQGGGGVDNRLHTFSSESTWRDFQALFQRHGLYKGVTTLYRGIGNQLMRVAPPSAIGLLIFEIANSQLWDDEDDDDD